MRPRGFRNPSDRREGRRGISVADVLLRNRTPHPDAPILRVLEGAKRAAGVQGPVLVRVANSRHVEPGAEVRPGRPPGAWLSEATPERGAHAAGDHQADEGFLLVRLPHPSRLGALSGRPWLDARAAAERFEEVCRFGMDRVARLRAAGTTQRPYGVGCAPAGLEDRRTGPGVGPGRPRRRGPVAALGAALLKGAARVEAAGARRGARRAAEDTEEVS